MVADFPFLEVHMPTKRWSSLSKRSRTLLVVAAAFEGSLKLAALIDIVKRPASRVKGSKAKWATAVVLVNSAGLVPIAYFLRGRQAS